MLILTRRISESTRINSDIAITILGVKGSQVRLGIQAPAGVSVHREEIFDKIVDQGGTLPATVPVAAVDPRDLFIAANPIGASENELVKAPVSGFIDDRVHADYLIFLAGFQALANRTEALGRQP